MCLPERIAPWRRHTGLGLFLLGLFLPALIPAIYLVGIDGWIAVGLTVAFSVGLPELLWALAALIIGRDGLRHLWRITRLVGRRIRRRMRRATP